MTDTRPVSRFARGADVVLEASNYTSRGVSGPLRTLIISQCDDGFDLQVKPYCISPREVIHCPAEAAFFFQSSVLAADQGSGQLSTRLLPKLVQSVPPLCAAGKKVRPR